MVDNSGFQAVFEQLKRVLQQDADSLVVTANDATRFSLDTKRIGPNKQPLFFGAVEIKKNYVSYHLFPLYMYPSLVETISPMLKKRMQGKSCFNFKTIDQETLTEIAELTVRGFEQFKSA